MESYDPALAFEDRLPQPYRMIDKVLREHILRPVYQHICPEHTRSRAENAKMRNETLIQIKKSRVLRLRKNETEAREETLSQRARFSATCCDQTMCVWDHDGSMSWLDATSLDSDSAVEHFQTFSNFACVSNVSSIIRTNNMNSQDRCYYVAVATARSGEGKVERREKEDRDDASEKHSEDTENTKTFGNEDVESSSKLSHDVWLYRRIASTTERMGRLALSADENIVSIQLSSISEKEGFYVLAETKDARVLLFPISNELFTPLSSNTCDDDEEKEGKKGTPTRTFFDAHFTFGSSDPTAQGRPLTNFVHDRETKRNRGVVLQLSWSNDMTIRKIVLPSATSTLTKVTRMCPAVAAREGGKNEENALSLDALDTLARRKHIGAYSEDMMTSTSVIDLVSGISTISMRGRILAVGCADGSLSLWNGLTPVDILVSTRAHAAPIRAIAVYQESRVISGADDGSVFVHRISPYETTDTDRLISARDGDGVPIVSVKTMPNVALAVVVNADGAVFVYALDTGRCIGSLGKTLVVGRSIVPTCVLLREAIVLASEDGGELRVAEIGDVLGYAFPAIERSLESDNLDGAKRNARARAYFERSKPSQRSDTTVLLRLDCDGDDDIGGIGMGDAKDGGGNVGPTTLSSTNTLFAAHVRALTNRLDRRIDTASSQLSGKHRQVVSRRSAAASVFSAASTILRSKREISRSQRRMLNLEASATRKIESHDNMGTMTSTRVSTARPESKGENECNYVVLPTSASTNSETGGVGAFQSPELVASSFLKIRVSEVSGAKREARRRYIDGQQSSIARLLGRRERERQRARRVVSEK